MPIIRINGKCYARLNRHAQMQRGDLFRPKKNTTYTRRGWQVLIRPLPNNYAQDNPAHYPDFEIYREIDPLLYAMQQAKDREKKRKQQQRKDSSYGKAKRRKETGAQQQARGDVQSAVPADGAQQG